MVNKSLFNWKQVICDKLEYDYHSATWHFYSGYTNGGVII